MKAIRYRSVVCVAATLLFVLVHPLPTAAADDLALIILSSSDPAAAEVVVYEGSTFQLNPVCLNSRGERVEGVSLNYISVDPQIASVDSAGKISGRRVGFSTVAVTSGGLVATTAVAVVKAGSGVQGFQITGIAQSTARRVYVAGKTHHTILLADDLQSQPAIYAGVDGKDGLLNAGRPQALFRNPGFLVLNRANGQLYVSDEANHCIRVVQPGPNGKVETLAGTGVAGSSDGALKQASFNRPAGVVLDAGGHLWVADSGNHTIRRINLATGQVLTVAGKAGERGSSDGTGTAARFNSPAGLALEREPLARQMERETRGMPAPPAAVIVVDRGNGKLRRVEETGEVETVGNAP